MTYYQTPVFDRQHRSANHHTNQMSQLVWERKTQLLRTQQPLLRPIRSTRIQVLQKLKAW